ncbi:MAG: hypothetical protein LUC90_05525 [Lachnospiraceae bacterium]|nr:hypothetical protein [Lachnospiraceae bacterium]
MTTAEEKYQDIIHRQWDNDPAFFRKHPRMPLQDRAKIFAPFAALRGHSDRLLQESDKLLRSQRTELSEEEAAVLSDQLLQVKKGMEITVVYFEADAADNDIGCYLSLTGRVIELDTVYRTLRIATGESNDRGEIIQTVRFDDLAAIYIETYLNPNAID